MIGMVSGERPNPVRAEELVLVEHPRQDPAELRLVEDGGEPPAPMTDGDRIMDRSP
jgi:hypothetical protein